MQEGIGRYTVPPHTAKRTTTNLKTKNNQNCQKNQTLWKSDNQGIKEEKFIQTGRRDGDGQRGHMARWQLEDQVVPLLYADKLRKTTGG